MPIFNQNLKKRILEISFKNNLSHLGSCFTSVDLLDAIYQIKKKNEPVILSCGHAGLALYCVIEKYGGKNAEEIFRHHGVHPDRCEICNIDCSTGSLGQGFPISVGMALSDRSKKVYCLISDCECAEGSIFEAFRIMGENKLKNLHVYLNWNGWGAYKEIKYNPLPEEFDQLYTEVITSMSEYPEYLQGQDAHYHIMTKEEYETYIL